MVDFECSCGFVVKADKDIQVRSIKCRKCGEIISLNKRARIEIKKDPVPRYNHWLPLHRYAVENAATWDSGKARIWFIEWQSGIQDIGCGCMDHWREMVVRKPPRFSSPQEFFQWTHEVHDAVSARIGRQRYSLEEAAKIHWPNGTIA